MAGREEAMSNVLVRGIPKRVHDRIQKLAQSKNLSVNQALIQLIEKAIEHLEEKDNQERERAEVFRRVEELRERLRREYGKFDDSTKLVREDRDSH